MIHNIDENVGRVLTRLHEWGIAERTLVVFMNDNGGTEGTRIFNAGMRSKKGSAFLGGTRASSFWRWPGTLNPADCPALAAHLDFFPTMAEIAGASLTAATRAQIRGRSLVPLLRDPLARWPDRLLFTHRGRWPKGAAPSAYKFTPCSIRTPRWHLVSAEGGTEPRWMLFDVSRDYGETTDVSRVHGEVVKVLEAAYEDWWAGVQPHLVNEAAEGPKENPFKERYRKQFGAALEPRL